MENSNQNTDIREKISNWLADPDCEYVDLNALVYFLTEECGVVLKEEEEEEPLIDCVDCDYSLYKGEFDAGYGRIMFNDINEDGTKYRCGCCDDRVADPQGMFPDDEEELCPCCGTDCVECHMEKKCSCPDKEDYNCNHCDIETDGSESYINHEDKTVYICGTCEETEEEEEKTCRRCSRGEKQLEANDIELNVIDGVGLCLDCDEKPT